jgi:hypothetical protein
MNVNFFGWIRDGVRQSVLLGVSDAIETLGTPDDPQTMHPSVSALLRRGSKGCEVAGPAQALPTIKGRSEGHPAARKRLGRSLKEINPNPAQP